MITLMLYRNLAQLKQEARNGSIAASDRDLYQRRWEAAIGSAERARKRIEDLEKQVATMARQITDRQMELVSARQKNEHLLKIVRSIGDAVSNADDLGLDELDELPPEEVSDTEPQSGWGFRITNQCPRPFGGYGAPPFFKKAFVRCARTASCWRRAGHAGECC